MELWTWANPNWKQSMETFIEDMLFYDCSLFLSLLSCQSSSQMVTFSNPIQHNIICPISILSLKNLIIGLIWGANKTILLKWLIISSLRASICDSSQFTTRSILYGIALQHKLESNLFQKSLVFGIPTPYPHSNSSHKCLFL